MIGAVAIAVIAAILVVNGLRPIGDHPAARPSGSPSAQISPSVAPSPSGVTPTPRVSGATSAVKPDAQHGLIVATGNMRTEADERGLQQPSLFQLAPTSAYAVSPDGKRVALIRTSQTGQQIVTFTTARPNDVSAVADLSGSGERASGVVWAGDGSDSILFAVVKDTQGPAGGMWDYSAVRSVSVTSHDVQEIGRIAGQNTALSPLAWLPARQIVGALEVRTGRPIVNYVTIRNGIVERTAISPNPNSDSFSASRDGLRVVVSLSTSLRWWPVDQPSAATDLPGQPGEKLGRAEFRPGTDDLGVEVPEGGRLEIWTLTGQRRVAASRVGNFIHWRADGTAAIASPGPDTVLLIDPVTGAATPLPGGGFPVADVVMF